MIWTTAESGVYLISSCLPSLRSLFNQLFKGVDLRSIRSRFLGYGSRLTSNRSTAGDIHLSNVSAGALNTNARSGFQKLDEPWRSTSLSDGNDQKGLVTCKAAEGKDTAKASSSLTDLESGKLSNGIRVQRETTLYTEPRNMRI
jgi:hypothetical protein